MNNQTKEEIISEVDEDLQLQSGLVLGSKAKECLSQNGVLYMTPDQIKPFLTKLREYLTLTQENERVWTLGRITDVGNNYITSYVLIIQNSTN